MIRGTTPTHFFELPFDTEIIDKVKIIYAQQDDAIFIKEKKDCVCEGNVIKVRLSQEETLLFDYQKPVQIQIRVLTNNGDAMASEIKNVSVGKCLESEVL